MSEHRVASERCRRQKRACFYVLRIMVSTFRRIARAFALRFVASVKYVCNSALLFW